MADFQTVLNEWIMSDSSRVVTMAKGDWHFHIIKGEKFTTMIVPANTPPQLVINRAGDFWGVKYIPEVTGNIIIK